MHHDCNNCGASYTLEPNDSDTGDMLITHCPFCGTEIVEELDFS